MLLIVKKSEERTVAPVLLLFYVIAVLGITLFVRDFDLEKEAILNPLRKYMNLADAFGKGIRKGGASEFRKCLSTQEHVITEIVLNVLLFVPLGFLVPKVREFFGKWWRILLLGLALSVTIEVTQLLTHLGCFDVCDLVHNTLGAGIGFLLWRSFVREKTPS